MNTFLLLSAGLGLGAIHAFDPDHLAAVGVVGAQDQSRRPTYWKYALRWSLGHGVALCLIAVCVIVLGFPFSNEISHLAEASVAYLLIGLGAFGIYSACTDSRAKDSIDNSSSSKNHVKHHAGFMGLIHGTAGSAALLALIPITKVSSALLGVTYVLSFSAGVALAMIVLGASASFFLQKLCTYFESGRTMISMILCFISLSLGLYLLFF